jgi:hypothetical protein
MIRYVTVMQLFLNVTLQLMCHKRPPEVAVIPFKKGMLTEKFAFQFFASCETRIVGIFPCKSHTCRDSNGELHQERALAN